MIDKFRKIDDSKLSVKKINSFTRSELLSHDGSDKTTHISDILSATCHFEIVS